MNATAVCLYCRTPIDKSTQGFTQSHTIVLHSGACHRLWHANQRDKLNAAIQQKQQFQGLQNVYR